MELYAKPNLTVNKNLDAKSILWYAIKNPITINYGFLLEK